MNAMRRNPVASCGSEPGSAAASRAARGPGVTRRPVSLDGEPDLLPVRDLERVTVGIAEERPVADGISRIERTEAENVLAARECAETIDLVPRGARDTEMRQGTQRRLDLLDRDEHDHERARSVREPGHLGARFRVAAAMHDRHARVALVEREARGEVGRRQGDVGEAEIRQRGRSIRRVRRPAGNR